MHTVRDRLPKLLTIRSHATEHGSMREIIVQVDVLGMRRKQATAGGSILLAKRLEFTADHSRLRAREQRR